MKIKYAKLPTKDFLKLCEGDCFVTKYNGTPFMKIDEIGSFPCSYNAVNLVDGSVTYFDSNCPCTPLNVTVEINFIEQEKEE